MKAFVDADICMGCGICEGICPEVFRMDTDVAIVLLDPVPDEFKDAVLEAVDGCPEEAIRVE